MVVGGALWRKKFNRSQFIATYFVFKVNPIQENRIQVTLILSDLMEMWGIGDGGRSRAPSKFNIVAENTHLLCKGMYHCTADLLFYRLGFGQTSKSVDSFNSSK